MKNQDLSLSTEPTIFSTKTGKFFCSEEIDNKMYRTLKDTGEYGTDEVQYLKLFLNTESIVFDVGAHIGTFSIPLSVGIKKLYSFEPNPTNLKVLKHNIELNNIDNIEIIQHPVADSIYSVKLNETQASSQTHVEKSQDGLVTTTLDSLNVVPNLMKIDIEGFEYNALLGSKEILKNKPIIYLEYTSWTIKRAGNTTSQLQKLLDSNGYQLYFYLEYCNSFVKLPSIKFILNKLATCNILCIPKGEKLPEGIPLVSYTKYFFNRFGNKLKRVLSFSK